MSEFGFRWCPIYRAGVILWHDNSFPLKPMRYYRKKYEAKLTLSTSNRLLQTQFSRYMDSSSRFHICILHLALRKSHAIGERKTTSLASGENRNQSMYFVAVSKICGDCRCTNFGTFTSRDNIKTCTVPIA
ncbi:hypothetical protein CHS0354_036744, partial [Potamilus streckersoni]